MRIIKEDSVGLIIDIQERLIPYIYAQEKLLGNIELLLEGLKILHVPLLITEQYRKGLGETLKSIQEIITDINPYEKMAFSCCDSSDFMNALEQSGKRNVIITGIESHVCVLQTVVDLKEKGFQPVVVEDCTGSRKLNDKEIAIERMKAEGAIITTYESILFELSRVAGTETFKKISKLVK